MTQKKNHRLASVEDYRDGMFQKPARYRTRNLPAAGSVLGKEDEAEQLSLI